MSEKSRIRWLCRRGMKELDVLLERFVGAEYDELDKRRHDEFARLLQMEDPDLYARVMAHVAPDNDVQASLLDDIRAFQRPGTAG